MKKIFTLVFAIACATATIAQKRDNSYNRNDRVPNNRYNNGYNNYLRERDEQISRINFRYKVMIRDIAADRYLRQTKKRREIDKLERERVRKIDALLARYNAANYNRTYAYGRP